MKIPLSPPSLNALFEAIPDDRFPQVLGQGRPLVSGKYLHWDALRHRKPPKGLTHEEWWLGIKYSRISACEAMPFVDKAGSAFTLVYVPPIRQGLHRIDQSFGMTGHSAGPPADVKAMVDVHGGRFLLTNSLMEEAIRSSQLEGASTTRAKAKDMIREKRDPRNKSEQMILNNFLAMERIEELSESPLTAEIFFELHSMLADGTLDDPSKAGVLRTDEDNVVVELLHSIETAHVPPPAGELPERLSRTLAFANAETPDDWLHPVLRAIILHFMIGYDHPFVDGNGRVARALFYWAMLRHGYPLTKYLSISRVLRDAPAKYSRAYSYTETDGSDLTYFVDHQIQVVLQSIEALGKYVETKVQATREIEAALPESPELNHRQLRLLSHALRHPGFEYTVRSHQTSHRVVTNTARADLVGLADLGLLVKTKRGRKHVFIAPRDLEPRIQDLNAA